MNVTHVFTETLSEVQFTTGPSNTSFTNGTDNTTDPHPYEFYMVSHFFYYYYLRSGNISDPHPYEFYMVSIFSLLSSVFLYLF